MTKTRALKRRRKLQEHGRRHPYSPRPVKGKAKFRQPAKRTEPI